MENKIIDLIHSISTVDNELNDLTFRLKGSNDKDQISDMIKGLKSYRLGLTHALEIMELE